MYYVHKLVPPYSNTKMWSVLSHSYHNTPIMFFVDHLTCMQPHVHLLASRCGEALQAVLALEGFHTCVCLHVCCEGALNGKGPETLLALERLLMGMDADMANQVTRLLELLGAVRTAVPANAIFFPDGTWNVFSSLDG